MNTFTTEEQYEERVRRRGFSWLALHYQNRAGASLEGKKGIYKIMIKNAMPELISVIDGEGLWRVPYFDRQDKWGTALTEAVSLMMDDLEGRWKCFAAGTDQNKGDVFVVGPLTQQEQAQVSHGQFPPSLAMYGRLGPGVCGPPNQALVIEPGHTRSQRSSRAPSRRHYDDYGVDYIPSRPPRAVADPYGDYGANYVSHSPYRTRLSRQPRPPLPEPTDFRHQRPRKYFAPPSDLGSESASDEEEEHPPRRAPRGKAAKGKPKGKPSRRRRSPSIDFEDDDELVLDDDELTFSDDEFHGKRLSAAATQNRDGAEDDRTMKTKLMIILVLLGDQERGARLDGTSIWRAKMRIRLEHLSSRGDDQKLDLLLAVGVEARRRMRNRRRWTRRRRRGWKR